MEPQKITVVTDIEMIGDILEISRSQFVLNYEGGVIAVKSLDSKLIEVDVIRKDELIARAYNRLGETLGIKGSELLEEVSCMEDGFREPCEQDALDRAAIEVWDEEWLPAKLLYIEHDEEGENVFVAVVDNKTGFYYEARVKCE